MKLAQMTGEELHKLFDKELSKIKHGGANYYRRRKAFEAVVEKIKEANKVGN